jgi:hypothetical protein
VHDALEQLAVVNPRLAKVVECRFFAGFDEKQTAEALGTSERTVQRDWATARAWLKKVLGTEGQGHIRLSQRRVETRHAPDGGFPACSAIDRVKGSNPAGAASCRQQSSIPQRPRRAFCRRWSSLPR